MRCVTHFYTLMRHSALMACLLVSPTAHAQWATIDWTVAETLLAIEAPVSGVAQQPSYHDWVGEPRIPPYVADLGLRTQPNFELLAQLAPEHTLISAMFAGLTPRLEHISPVTSLALYSPGTNTWDEMQSLTRELGELTNRETQAERLISDTRTMMTDLRSQTFGTEPLLMVQFMDARHVRVFGENSLYNAVLQQLELSNAWDQATNAWGFSLIGIEALANYPDATLVVVEPLPTGVEAELANSGLWQHLLNVKHTPVVYLPPVWSFGALPSAQRFAQVLTAALQPHSGQPDEPVPGKR